LELGKIISREPGNFKKRYPNADEGRNTRTQNEMLEELQEVCRILRKNEETWTSAKYYELLHWKIVHGHSVYKTKSEGRKKWHEILANMTEEAT
jgi:hypothetical protein